MAEPAPPAPSSAGPRAATPAPAAPSGVTPGSDAPLVALEEVGRTHADRTILDRATFFVREGERVGLLGVNGAGKTTLLRLMAGLEIPDGGRVTRRRGLRMAVLAQEAEIATEAGPEATVDAILHEGQREHRDALRRLERTDDALAHAKDAKERATLLERRVQEEALVDALGGHDPEREIDLLASDLGLPPRDRRVRDLSGGERRRTALARALLERPDLLLLDEPTNHLDAETVEHLEERCLAWRGAIVFVTHDRAFLDAVATRIVEVSRGRLFLHEGGYARFLEAVAAREERETSTDTARRAYLRAELRWLASGVKAQRRKGKERVEKVKSMREELGKAPPVEPQLELRLPEGPRLGDKVIEVTGASKGHGGRKLFHELTFRLAPGDRLGVVGRNGVGKSTLLRLLLGQERPDAGTVALGPTARLCHVDQQRLTLDPEKTVLEETTGDRRWVRLAGQDVNVSTYLQRFLFPPERQRARVKTLSGGERSRLALAKLLLEGGNVVLLDEPTNDLDLETLRALEEAVLRFEGALVIVSHDRWFLDRTATRTLALEGDGKWTLVDGGYERWRDLRDERARERAQAEKAAKESARGSGGAGAMRATEAKPAGGSGGAGKTSDTQGAAAAGPAGGGARPTRALSAKEKRELTGMAAAIEAQETEAQRLSDALADPGLYSDPSRREEARRLTEALKASRAEGERLFARWEELESKRAGG